MLMLSQCKFMTRDALSFTQVLLDGALVAKSNRDAGSSLVFYAPSSGGADAAMVLSVVVEAVGRSNGGCDWDFKGLQSGNVTLNGACSPVTRASCASVSWPGTALGQSNLQAVRHMPAHWVKSS